jgi:AcrR family transcriptional regulator
MARRQYVSAARDAAAAETRGRVITAAAEILAEGDISGFSLDAVAQRAKVTRLTVYNQFGSRRGLLEAVFDERARRGGLFRIAAAMAMPDARKALDRLVAIFCDFWDSDRSIGQLHAATSIDAEFARALEERNERRRKALDTLVEQIAGGAPPARRRDAVDVMFTLTSHAVHASLRNSRSNRAVCALITRLCHAALAAVEPPP